jgi:5-deoxy-glucuronate isomerase
VDDVLVRRAGEFAVGHALLVDEDDALLAPGIELGIRVLAGGVRVRERCAKETAWVLLDGEAEVASGPIRERASRRSLLDELPTTLHVAAGSEVVLEAAGRAEWAVLRATNPRSFPPRLFAPGDCVREARGRGLAQGACEREVRLIFDLASRPESALVVGEVVNLPGRWSSYPPHRHAQPEIYHYRFSEPQGYGHAELGEQVLRVRTGDTLRIPGGRSHAQVAAPGYAMWYLWAVRHLDGAPYRGFETEPEHAWVLDASRQGWRPPS